MKKIIRNIRRLEKFGGKKHATPPKKAKTQKKPNTPYFKPNGIHYGMYKYENFDSFF